MVPTMICRSFVPGVLLVPALFLVGMRPPIKPGPRNRYIGAKACKNCHKNPAKGGQYGKWKESRHAQAWQRLASDEAKKVAAKLGIADPQKSPKCLECHVTAFHAKKRDRKRGFVVTMGVQCEACHGPGERHFKKRFVAAAAGKADPDAYRTVAAGEIVVSPPADTCLRCHNDRSPSFKPFCYKERAASIRHLDPRKKRAKAQLDALACRCEECKCRQAECGGRGAPKPAGVEDKKRAAPRGPQGGGGGRPGARTSPGRGYRRVCR